MRALGRDAEVGAHRGDPVGLRQPGAGFPAVAQLLLLVDERQALALVGLRLDPADLVRARLVVEQQDDQALYGRQVFVALRAGELRARLGGEQPPLPVVDHCSGLARVGSVADARHELAGAHQHPGEALDPLAGDLAARVRRELERVELDPLDPPVDRSLGDGRDVEQGGTGLQGRVRCLHQVASFRVRVGSAAARAAVPGGERGDRVGGDVVERLCGIGDHGDAVALDRQRRDPDAEVDRRDAQLGEPPDPLDSRPCVGPAAVREHIDEPGPAGVVISSRSETSSIASPANAVPPPVRIPGTSDMGLVPSASSSALLPNRAVAQRPPIWRSPSVRIQAIGPSAYS